MTAATAADVSDFAARLLAWFDAHGRHDLPWQRDRQPYRVWISEIMLQQTQVATVIAYFERFVQRFPTLGVLAVAPRDDVLALWSGLGYYARARNLHATAQIVVERHGGELPTDLEALVALPGIGRSTAAAILALSSARRVAILDGNVKRVLARYHAVAAWPGLPAAQRLLWAHAERHTPHDRVAAYTQAIMDLGATVCVRARPRCEQCPLAENCAAREQGLEDALPARRPRRPRPQRAVTALVVRDGAGRVLLERRPERGIWGGLYSFPELRDGDAAHDWCRRLLGAGVARACALPAVDHAFTHFDLELRPVELELDAAPSAIMDGGRFVWHGAADALPGGMAAPIAKILRERNIA